MPVLGLVKIKHSEVSCELQDSKMGEFLYDVFSFKVRLLSVVYQKH